MVQPNGLKYVMESEVPVCVCEGGQLFALQLAKLAFFIVDNSLKKFYCKKIQSFR